jgi:hypothetical protein
MHGMRRPMRCELVAMQCAANCLRCNALRAGWLHSRGAGGPMLLTEGFLGWGVWADGWAEGWVGGWWDGFKSWIH